MHGSFDELTIDRIRPRTTELDALERMKQIS